MIMLMMSRARMSMREIVISELKKLREKNIDEQKIIIRMLERLEIFVLGMLRNRVRNGPGVEKEVSDSSSDTLDLILTYLLRSFDRFNTKEKRRRKIFDVSKAYFPSHTSFALTHLLLLLMTSITLSTTLISSSNPPSLSSPSSTPSAQIKPILIIHTHAIKPARPIPPLQWARMLSPFKV